MNAVPPSAANPPVMNSFTPYQKFILAILAFLQFTIILDFMILSPLGAMLMPALQIGPQEFGLVVSAYAFSAGASGLLAGGFADRFDRKRMLLVFYAGFVTGTLLCGLAPTYPLLLGARIITGLFGGVIGSIVFAITTDLFPFQMRGRVMGILQTAFAASQVLGIPIGLALAGASAWHAPFFMIVAVSVVVGIIIVVRMEPIRGHLATPNHRNPLQHLGDLLRTPRYLQAFATTALMATGGFMLMPFGSAFSVHNLGVPMDKLPLVYGLTGVASLVAGPLVGRAADTLGKFRVFMFGTALTVVMVLIYTHLGPTPLPWVVLVSAIMFVGVSSRMIPSQALMSAIPEPAMRGAFMSVSSSIQQVSGGLAAVLAGMIVVEGPDGVLQHFDRLGYVVVLAACITGLMMWSIQRRLAVPTA